VTCSDPSGTNEFKASGSQTIFTSSKVLQAVDSNFETSVDGPVTTYSTVYFAYFIENPSAAVYNLVIEATDSVSGTLTSFTQAIQSD
jgi:hypothetical protein